jgi:hypothetical protein
LFDLAVVQICLQPLKFREWATDASDWKPLLTMLQLSRSTRKIALRTLHDHGVLEIATCVNSLPGTRLRVPSIYIIRHFRWICATTIPRVNKQLEVTGKVSVLVQMWEAELPKRIDRIEFQGSRDVRVGEALPKFKQYLVEILQYVEDQVGGAGPWDIRATEPIISKIEAMSEDEFRELLVWEKSTFVDDLPALEEMVEEIQATLVRRY